MQIPHYGNGRKYWLDIALFHEEFGRGLAETSEGAFGETFAGAEGGEP